MQDNHSPFLGLSLFTSVVASLYLLQNYSLGKRTNSSSIEVEGLYIYPIKSCGGTRVTSVYTSKTGLQGDRICIILDSENKMVTQRKLKNMNYILPVLSENLSMVTLTLNKQKILDDLSSNPLYNLNIQAIMSFEDLAVSLVQPTEQLIRVEARVWDDLCECFQINPIEKISQWLSTALSLTFSEKQKADQDLHSYIKSLKLCRFLDTFVRHSSEKYAKDVQTSLADGYPFLICSISSVLKLQDRLIEKYGKEHEEEIRKYCTIDNFRPNIVVRNCNEFEEDFWHEIEFLGSGGDNPASLKAEIVKPCARCPMINRPFSFTDSVEPRETLKTYRAGKHLNFKNPKWQAELFFGQNLHHYNKEGYLLRVGDKVSVTSLLNTQW